ncbi:hypothetical protein EVAR_34792_1 [Eumeta japonica]|uniref:Uncharacterized protein n=1 Tax=Eumeta variegata TaxID=151549 RepID=A0A4C1WCU5_EUMVA|nr:hypothetical protein EVAR_34792_1 [Eumeta japonica]
MEETSKDLGETNRGEPSSKTSFLIEDILFRGPNRSYIKQPAPDVAKRLEYERDAKYFGPTEPRVHIPGQEGSYLQVAMGALGAYLHTPNAYKTVETPYFLSQVVTDVATGNSLADSHLDKIVTSRLPIRRYLADRWVTRVNQGQVGGF